MPITPNFTLPYRNMRDPEARAQEQQQPLSYEDEQTAVSAAPYQQYNVHDMVSGGSAMGNAIGGLIARNRARGLIAGQRAGETAALHDFFQQPPAHVQMQKAPAEIPEPRYGQPGSGWEAGAIDAYPDSGIGILPPPPSGQYSDPGMRSQGMTSRGLIAGPRPAPPTRPAKGTPDDDGFIDPPELPPLTPQEWPAWAKPYSGSAPDAQQLGATPPAAAPPPQYDDHGMLPNERAAIEKMVMSGSSELKARGWHWFDRIQERKAKMDEQNSPDALNQRKTDEIKLQIMQKQLENSDLSPEAKVDQLYKIGKAHGLNEEQAQQYALSGGTLNKATADDGGYAMRQKQAVGMGMDPAGDAYKSFVLTGKLPREDQQSLTSTDKKAILEADDMVSSNASAIDALGQAKSLSPKANSGWFAGTRASLANNLPDWLVPDFISSPEGGEATANLDNAVIANAVTQLKTIFGGNPTEGERKILLDLQGSSNQPDNVRQGIYGRAKAAAEKRLAFNKQRASELRGGTYYKPDGGISGASGVSQSPPDSASPPAPDEAVAELMANPTPEMQTHFDEVFGPGAAQAALNAKRAP